MHAGQKTTLYTIIVAVAAALLIFVAGLWLLTRPGITTPLVERVVGIGTGRSVAVDRAWVSYWGGPELHIRGIDIPDRLQAAIVDIRPNIFGLVPGVPVASRVHAEDGRVIIDRRDPASQSTEYEDYIDTVSLSGLDVSVLRKATTSRFTIIDAAGSLHGGDLTIKAVAGDGEVLFEGGGRLSSLNTVEGTVRIKGPNLARVAEALGIAAPDVPPFELTGQLAIEADAWVLTGITGEIGESDIGGDLTVEFGEERPRIVTDLKSERLDFDDVGIVIGLPSQNEGGEPLNEAQQEANEHYAQSRRFIPDAAIDTSRLSMVDARIVYEADQVIDAPLEISTLNLDMNLASSRLSINSLSAAMAQGRVTLNGVLDASNDPARSDLTADITGLNLETLVPGRNALGQLEGRASLALTGSDFRTAFANSSGEVVFWAENARLAAVPVEAMDLDIGEIFITLLSQDPDDPVYVDAPCIVARLDVEDGLGRTAPFVIDTEDALVIADGIVGFREETIDLSIEADAKDFSWGTILGDASVGGSWRDPDINVGAEGPLAQGLIAGLLASVAGPLGALPFIDTGDGEGAPCAELLRRAKGAENG